MFSNDFNDDEGEEKMGNFLEIYDLRYLVRDKLE